MKKSSKVLQDHQRKGKLFIPPLLYKLGDIHTSSYLKQILPQLVWWDIISWKTSLKTTALIAKYFCDFFRALQEFSHWWAFASNYYDLNDEKVDELKAHLHHNEVFEILKNSLHDFLLLYPACPLNKIFCVKGTEFHDPNFLENFKIRISDLFDRRSINAIQMQAQAVYMGFLSGHLKVNSSTSLAEFPEISKYPTTPNSIKIASSICALLNGITGIQLSPYQQDQWATYFWNRGSEIDPIDFSYLDSI